MCIVYRKKSWGSSKRNIKVISKTWIKIFYFISHAWDNTLTSIFGREWINARIAIFFHIRFQLYYVLLAAKK